MIGEEQILENEEKNRRKALITSTIVNAIVILLLILPLMSIQVPPPGQPGLLVSLGLPNVGQGDDKPDMQNEKPEPPKPEPPKQTAPPVESKPEPVKQEQIQTSEDPESIALKKKQKEEAETKKKQLEEARKKQAEEDARRKAEEEAARKAQEEADRKQAEYDEASKQYGDLFGSGKGKTNTAGNQGDPNGDPNAKNLEGISTGSGTVGGGLGDRGVLFEPVINDNSQKTGRVVVKVCVDTEGHVVSADYTQKGSTTTDATLRDLAIRSAKKFRFTKSSIDKQCGTITIDFRVK
ncbi:MAG: cell envelope integrity protein TolA [Saprospiraceae bacterium]|nr:cell envelope integrity protein TolA [Saprospiraceae bacterium]